LDALRGPVRFKKTKGKNGSGFFMVSADGGLSEALFHGEKLA
jgi:hypothetical protein